MSDKPGGLLNSQLAELAWPKPVVFAAACAQRLFGGYVRYHEHTGAGDPDTLHHLLAALWQGLTEDVDPPEYGRLADECEALVSDTLNNWILAAQYAEDAVAATVFALRCAAGGDYRDATLSADREFESIDTTVQYELEAGESEFDAAGPFTEHPLVLAEERRQAQDIEDLREAVETDQIRSAALVLRNRASLNQIHG